MTTDPRYRCSRWRNHVRPLVLARDMNRCWVQSCERPANVADHIEPVYEGMPDSLFFDVSNLRASCKPHNLRRGHVAQFERDLANGVAPAPRRYSIGRGSPAHHEARTARRLVGRSFEALRDQHSALPKYISTERWPVVTRDYTRKPTESAG